VVKIVQTKFEKKDSFYFLGREDFCYTPESPTSTVYATQGKEYILAPTPSTAYNISCSPIFRQIYTINFSR